MAAYQIGSKDTFVFGGSLAAPVVLDSGNVVRGHGLLGALAFSGLSENQDAITVSPPADGNAREYAGFSRVYVLQNTGGREAVVADVSADGQRLSRFVVDRCFFRANGAGNYAFRVKNPTNAVDRFFVSTFEKSVFSNGLNLDGVGDSINVTENTFTGENEAVRLVQTTSASSGGAGNSSICVIQRNNSTANKGILVVDAQDVKIRDNNLECGDGPGAGEQQALINLLGATDTILGAEVTGNVLNHAPNCTTGVYVGNADGALIENNVFGVAASGYSIVVSASAKNTVIGKNHFVPKGTGREVIDSGQGTKGVWKTPSYQNGWTDFGGTYQAGRFMKAVNGTVVAEGTIKGGAVTSGTVLFTFPAGFRPQARVFFKVHALTLGGVFGVVTIRVDADGNVYLRHSSEGAAALTELSLDGIRFFAPDVP